jgi:hypothetical protein
MTELFRADQIEDVRVTTHPVIGQVSPDPASDLFGIGFKRFKAPTGIMGLGKVRGDRLDLLAVVAGQSGRPASPLWCNPRESLFPEGPVPRMR